MYIPIITAWSLDEAWWRCIREILMYGKDFKIDSGSYEGQYRKELDFIVVNILKPSMRPLSPSVPDGTPAPTNDDYIQNDYLPYLMTSAKKPGELYTYGEDLEPQMYKAIDMYKKGGHRTNRASMVVGNRDSIDLEHSQCLRQVDTRIQGGALHFFVMFRSWDMYGGFPVNLGGLQLMKEFMASEIGVNDGEIVAVTKGLHLYDHHWDLGKAATRYNV